MFWSYVLILFSFLLFVATVIIIIQFLSNTHNINCTVSMISKATIVVIAVVTIVFVHVSSTFSTAVIS